MDRINFCCQSGKKEKGGYLEIQNPEGKEDRTWFSNQVMFECFVVSNNTTTETLGYSSFFWPALTINPIRQILGAAYFGFEFIYEKVCLALFFTYSTNDILPKFNF